MITEILSIKLNYLATVPYICLNLKGHEKHFKRNHFTNG